MAGGVFKAIGSVLNVYLNQGERYIWRSQKKFPAWWHWFFWLFQFTVVQSRKTTVRRVPLQPVQMTVAIQMMVEVLQTIVSVLNCLEPKACWQPPSWVRKPPEPLREVWVKDYWTSSTSVTALQRETGNSGSGYVQAGRLEVSPLKAAGQPTCSWSMPMGTCPRLFPQMWIS